jgi:hypothetical protein
MRRSRAKLLHVLEQKKIRNFGRRGRAASQSANSRYIQKQLLQVIGEHEFEVGKIFLRQFRHPVNPAVTLEIERRLSPRSRVNVINIFFFVVIDSDSK